MMRRSAPPRTSSSAACVWAGALLTVLLLVVPDHPALASSCSTVTVPAYFYPGSAWERSVQGPGAVRRTLIANPASGPGTQQDAHYVTAIREASRTATVAGYVHTSYGRRPIEQVRADVARYRAFYGVRSIFFDEVSSSRQLLPYYASLSEEVRASGGRVLLNPGTHPDEGYMALADQVVTFEGTFATYRRVEVPAWTQKHPARKFTHLVYSTHGRHMGRALSLAAKRRAGNVYVTDDGGTNPWDTLPSYWLGELRWQGARCR